MPTRRLPSAVAACVLSACAAAAPSRESRLGTTSSPRVVAATTTTAATRPAARTVPPRIVSQRVREQAGYFYRGPGFHWIVYCGRQNGSGLSEVTIREAETGRVLDRFEAGGQSLRCMPAPDGTRVAVLALPLGQPPLGTPTAGVFDRAARRWLWRREVPAMHAYSRDLIVGEREVALSSCTIRGGQVVGCARARFDLASGEPRAEPPPRASPTEEPFGDWSVAPDGRYALVHERAASNVSEAGPVLPISATDPDASVWRVYSLATAQYVLGFSARCARFAADGTLRWVPGGDAAPAAAEFASLGIRAGTAAEASCPTTPRTVGDAQVTAASDDARFVLTLSADGATALRDLATQREIDEQLPREVRARGEAFGLRWLGRGHPIAWSNDMGLNVYGGSGAPLPRQILATQPARGGAFGPRVAAAVDPRDGSINIATGEHRLLRWRERDLGQEPPVTLTGPHGAPLDCTDCSVDEILADGAMDVGTRYFGDPTRPPGHLARLPAVRGGTVVAPAWLRVDDGWRLVWPDVLEGIQVIDATRGRAIGAYCTPQQGWGHTYGVWPTRDGRAAWVLVPTVAVPRPHTGLSLIELATGRVLRTLGGTDDVLVGSALPQLGWLVPDRQMWLTSGEHERVDLIDIPADERATAATVRHVPMPGAAHGTFSRDLAFFVASVASDAGVRVYRPDGAVVLTANVWRDGGYVYTPDGHFACERRGCELLRCTVEGQSRPADDPACASWRRPAITLEQALGE